MDWKHWRTSPLLEERSLITDNLGLLPRIATKEIIFKNLENDSIFKTTDVDIKKFYRNKRINEFQETYHREFINKNISILLIVHPIENVKYPSSIIRNLQEKLGRLGIYILGHIWMRDIGDKKFERHFHFMVATTRINRDHLIKIRSKRENNKTKIVLCKNINAFINYLVKKEIYAGTKKRSYGSSQFFKKQIEMDYMHIK